MAPLVRARSLSHSGAIRPTGNAFNRRTAQPIVALVSSRRSYWHSRGSKANDHLGGAYGYMMAYPRRALPHYVRHTDALQYAYMDSLARSRVQASRNSSHWSSDDIHAHGSNGKSKGSPSRQETPWETRTRLASERYLQLMEEHMALLKKDPYWSLFGSSELRGVWNPWRNSEALRKRVDEKTWKAWEDSKKAAENLRRAVKGETSKEQVSPVHPKKVEVDQASSRQQLVWSMQDGEYVYDPVSNKRVRRSPPSDHAQTVEIQRHPSPSPSSADHSQEVSIPVTKYKPSDAAKSSNTVAKPTTAISVQSTPRSVALTGFARWVNQIPTSGAPKSAASFKSTDKDNSAFAKVRLAHKHQTRRNQAREMDLKLSEADRLQTCLERRSQAKPNLEFDETVDRRENLDFLRPDSVRATMARADVSSPPMPTLPASERWAALEAAAAKAFQKREYRLSKEFAASKWNLKRNLHAYPGDIARTPEELRARRQLLEHSFTNSVDLIELEVAKVLGKMIVPADTGPRIAAASLADEKLVAQHRADAELNSKKAQLQAKVASLLQKEVSDQKAAMTAAVQGGIRAFKAAQAEELAKHAGKAPTVQAFPVNQATGSAVQVAEVPQINGGAAREQAHTLSQSRITTIKQSGESNKEANKVNSATSAQRDTVPYFRSSTNNAPSGVVPELDSSNQLLEAAVRDFEQILSQESGQTTERVKPSIREDTKVSTNVTKPQIFEKRIYPKHAPSASQADMDSLTAELKDIANQAPNAPKSATVTSSQADVVPANSYILLAYDKRERKLRMTRTSSSLHEVNAPKRTIDSIMSRLVEPSAYFEYMERLDKAGYELVAGGRQMLVYKDVLNRKLSPAALGVDTITPSPQRGWGSPETEQPKQASEKPPSKTQSRSVRRVEESFSGIPPRLESERITEDIERSQQQRSGPVWKVARGALILGTVFYFFGVTLEWLKLREKRRLVEEYQQEVKRVQELERARAREQTKGSGWGF